MGSDGDGIIEVQSEPNGPWVLEREIDFQCARGYSLWCYLFGVRCDLEDNSTPHGIFSDNINPQGSVGKSKKILDDINVFDTYGPYYIEYNDLKKIDYNYIAFDLGTELYYPFDEVFDDMRKLSKSFNNVRAIFWFD